MSVGTVLVLTALGSEVQGPLGSVFTRVGSGLGELESRVVRAVRGSGRAGELAWFTPYRQDAALLRNPEHILLGAYDGGLPASLEGVVSLEDSIGTTFPLIQFYTAWGDRPDQQFPWRLARAITDLGSVPVITWEPWLTAFENRLHPHLPLRDDRDLNGLAAVAAGDYDFYIDEWARNAAEFGEPIFLRFAHEMNDPYRYPWGPQNNRPEDFVAAWRHTVERFRAAGANNVLWVWAPHVAHEAYETFYPGDDYVDWVGTGVLNYGTVATWSEWWTFDEIYRDRAGPLAALRKPVMIAEFGSLAVGGDRTEWYRKALTDLPTRHPEVRAVLFFHVARDATITYQQLDWSFSDVPAITDAIREAIEPWVPPR